MPISFQFRTSNRARSSCFAVLGKEDDSGSDWVSIATYARSARQLFPLSFTPLLNAPGRAVAISRAGAARTNSVYLKYTGARQVFHGPAFRQKIHNQVRNIVEVILMEQPFVVVEFDMDYSSTAKFFKF